MEPSQNDESIIVFDEVGNFKEEYILTENEFTKLPACFDLDLDSFPKYFRPSKSETSFLFFGTKNQFDISCGFLLILKYIRKIIICSKCNGWDIDEKSYGDTWMKIYDLKTKKLDASISIPGKGDIINIVDLDSDILVLTSDGDIYRQNKISFMESPLSVERINFPKFATSVTSFEDRVIIGASDCKIYVADKNMDFLFSYPQSRSISTKLIISPVSPYFAAIGQSGTVECYSLDNPISAIFTTPPSTTLVTDASFMLVNSSSWKKQTLKSKGLYLLTVSNNGKVTAYPLYQASAIPSTIILADKTHVQGFNRLVTQGNVIYLSHDDGFLFACFCVMKPFHSETIHSDYEMRTLFMKAIQIYDEDGKFQIGDDKRTVRSQTTVYGGDFKLPEYTQMNFYKGRSVTYFEKLNDDWTITGYTDGTILLFKASQLKL